ncbi:hypothetical protein [Kutzneria chonburiensis]|uniref:Uncharacterized protein n=1 Tax=Kutzneria chonburiensis TaxID=1483604 RepID=A0ABV6N2W3_9PSEU|nr:hypothetical protein [Kutzneria chonburiensis]
MTLFDKPKPEPTELSTTLATAANRLAAGQVAKWTPVRVQKPRPCQECAQVQHEKHGQCPPRRQARHRRRHPHGPVLELCDQHALMWRERDEADATRRPS